MMALPGSLARIEAAVKNRVVQKMAVEMAAMVVVELFGPAVVGAIAPMVPEREWADEAAAVRAEEAEVEAAGARVRAVVVRAWVVVVKALEVAARA